MLIDGTPGRMLSAADRGLHYGDGIFETIAVHEGRPLLWDRHTRRLQSGCARLGIACPGIPILAEEADRLCRDAGRAVLKIMVTRGSGGRGYTPPDSQQPVRILSVHEWPAHPATHSRDGIDAPWCGIRLARQPALAGIKHLNRLEQVLARSELASAGAPEGVMLDTGGLVIEGTMSNLFAVRGGELWTPDLSSCGVEGVVRAEVLARAGELSLQPVIRALAPDDLLSADEAFLTNSIIGIWPLKSVGGRALPRGPRAADICRTLAAAGVIVPP